MIGLPYSRARRRGKGHHRAPGGSSAAADTKSYAFDGVDEYITADGVAGSGAYDWQSDAWSAATWFKTSETGLQYLWSFAKANDQHTWAAMRVQENYVWVFGFSVGSALPGTPVSPQGSNGWFGVKNTDTNGINPSDGNWHHAVLTVAGTANTDEACRLYIDGNYVAYAKQKSSTASMADFTIGCLRRDNGTSVQDFFGGRIFQMSLYRSALSASDVSDIYNSGTPVDETTLTPSPDQYYRFGDGDTNGPGTLTDYGDNAVDGTGVNLEAADIVEDSP